MCCWAVSRDKDTFAPNIFFGTENGPVNHATPDAYRAISMGADQWNYVTGFFLTHSRGSRLLRGIIQSSYESSEI